MQRAVERDDQNRSNYAISAVDPSYISATFNDIALHEVIDSIGHKTGLLLEIVNSNVEVSTSSTSLFALELITFLGSTARLWWRPCHFADVDQCPELLEGSESGYCQAYQTVVCWQGQGDARNHVHFLASIKLRSWGLLKATLYLKEDLLLFLPRVLMCPSTLATCGLVLFYSELVSRFTYLLAMNF